MHFKTTKIRVAGPDFTLCNLKDFFVVIKYKIENEEKWLNIRRNIRLCGIVKAKKNQQLF